MFEFTFSLSSIDKSLYTNRDQNDKKSFLTGTDEIQGSPATFGIPFLQATRPIRLEYLWEIKKLVLFNLSSLPA